jgi:hypothetical protein
MAIEEAGFQAAVSRSYPITCLRSRSVQLKWRKA